MNDFSASRTIYLLKRTEIMLRSMLEDALRDLPVTVGQYVVLSLLAHMPKASSADLSRKSGVTPQTISQTITLFENKGYIVRKQSAEHKRVLEINLTSSGERLLLNCEAMVDKIEDKLFSGMVEAKVDSLRNDLKAILRAGESRTEKNDDQEFLS